MASTSEKTIVKEISKQDLCMTLLKKWGYVSDEEITSFLNPSYEADLHDPFLLVGMDKAVERVLGAMKNDERIAIFSDYDCDGIPGGALLYDFFTKIGYTNFQNYIPHRHFEGFGFSTDAIDTLKSDGVTLIITVDCGTTNVKEVAYAKGQGINVIVTDHHEAGAELPPAIAILNHTLSPEYLSPICGTGTAFKLVQALIQKGAFDLMPGWEKWLLDLVAIATVADMVPLVGENRAFVHYGLKVLKKTRRPGLQHLLRSARIPASVLTEDDIGFTIAPRINAASRMDTPEDGFVMLTTNSESEAGTRVAHLEKLNNERKGVVAAMTKESKKRLMEVEKMADVIVLGNPAWRPSLVGLTATALVGEYNRPAFIWGRDGNGVMKGSCRSNGVVSVVTLMESAPHLFLEYGGHHMSGGFSVHEEHIYTFGKELNDIFKSLGDAVVLKGEERAPDATLSLEEVDDALLSMLRTLSPFGMGNEKPLFLFPEVSPVKVEQFGKGKEHLKLTLKRQQGTMESIAFFSSPTQFTKTPKEGTPLNLYAHVEESYFMGRRQVRLRIVDIR